MDITIIKPDSITSGDILLCYAKETVGKADGIENGYSHAAICLNQTDICESSGSGVKETNITKLLEDYEHIAVLRSREIWNEERINKLCEFCKQQVGKKFNLIGVKKYNKRKKANQETIMDQVHGVFDGTISPASPDKDMYFCSELITAAFISVGIIEKEAAVIFRPEIFSPEDIGRDKLFGFFVGYIIPSDIYKIPENDIFRTSL